MTSLDACDWAELEALLASAPLPSLDDGPAVEAPQVAVVEQGRLDLGSAFGLRARAAAVQAAHDLAVRAARLHAQDVDALVQVSRLTPQTTDLGSPHKALGLELAGARGLGQQQALREVRDALRLTEVLPLTLAGLRAGTLLLGQSRAIVVVTEHCAPEIASEAERRLFADPRAGLLSPSDLRLRLTRLLIEVETELDPAAQDEREQAAADGRRVAHFPLPDGMAGLYAEWTAQQGLTHAAALDELCHRVKTWDAERGHTRTAAQRRADVLAALPGWVLDLLDRPTSGTPTTAHPAPDDGEGEEGGVESADPADSDIDEVVAAPPPPGPPPMPFPEWLLTPSRTPRTIVNVHIPLASALGISQAAGYLERHGWISATHARRLLPEAELHPIHVDEHGQPLHTTTQPRTTTQDRGPGNHHDDAPDDPGRGGGSGGVRGGGGSGSDGGSSGRPPGPAGPLRICTDPSAQIHSHPHTTPTATPATPIAPAVPSVPAVPATPVAPETDPPGPAPTDWRTARPRTTAHDIRELLLAWGALPPPTLITTPEPQYEPSTRLARHVRTRDLRCTGPGCATPSHQSELDHLDPYGNGGPTAAWNLAPKSHRCHDAKTHGSWTSTRHPDSSTTWTSPLARRTWTPAFWPAPPAVPPGTAVPETQDPTHEPARWVHQQPDEHAPQHQRQTQDDAGTSAPDLRLNGPARRNRRPMGERGGQRQAPTQSGHARDWLHPVVGQDGDPPPF